MKNLLSITIALMLVLFASNALAERGQRGSFNGYYASQGERIDRHLDRQGSRIERRFEHRADCAEANGQYRKAERFRTRGEQINHHLDRKGDRIRARHDNRWQHHARAGHLKAPGQRTLHRGHIYDDSRYSMRPRHFNPWFGWAWRD